MSLYRTVEFTILTNTDVSVNARALYCYFSSYCGKSRYCFPSRETILNDLFIGKDRYYKYVNQLIGADLISVKRNMRSNNRYYLTNRGSKKQKYGFAYNDMMTNSALSLSTKLLYVYLSAYCPSGRNWCFKVGKISSETGMSPYQIHKGIDELCRAGYIITVNTNSYIEIWNKYDSDENTVPARKRRAKNSSDPASSEPSLSEPSDSTAASASSEPSSPVSSAAEAPETSNNEDINAQKNTDISENNQDIGEKKSGHRTSKNQDTEDYNRKLQDKYTQSKSSSLQKKTDGLKKFQTSFRIEASDTERIKNDCKWQTYCFIVLNVLSILVSTDPKFVHTANELMSSHDLSFADYIIGFLARYQSKTQNLTIYNPIGYMRTCLREYTCCYDLLCVRQTARAAKVGEGYPDTFDLDLFESTSAIDDPDFLNGVSEENEAAHTKGEVCPYTLEFYRQQGYSEEVLERAVDFISRSSEKSYYAEHFDYAIYESAYKYFGSVWVS